ncbi:hypothetical protein [Candidatus Ulvibacter alkanivorans]|uniref:hypothetical protein n=1 Tax=Candidatus Ulvibacter alkanivorans TaxID=2267620 RepID=UPI00109C932F|nr:hypothetical protein [Candidatus Ulvibacter alkanivorans]
MNDKVMIETLIDNLKEDVKLLEQVEEQLEPLERQKREISSRIKEHQRDAGVLIKYADENDQKQLEELGFVIPSSITGLNEVATIALEAIIKAKDRKLTNEQLHQAYEKIAKEQGEEVVNYTEFNIKCRPLFNSQKLVRKKGKDPKTSRDDMISLNGGISEKK